MGLLIYLPFSNLLSVEVFKHDMLLKVFGNEIEGRDLCTIHWDARKHLQIQHNQLLTSKGLIGFDFWELLITAILSKTSVTEFKGITSEINLSVPRSHYALGSLSQNLKRQNAALLLVLRKSNAQLIYQKLSIMHPDTLAIPYTDHDELNIQQIVTKRAKRLRMSSSDKNNDHKNLQ
jgi:uncharacterized membrane protein